MKIKQTQINLQMLKSIFFLHMCFKLYFMLAVSCNKEKLFLNILIFKR